MALQVRRNSSVKVRVITTLMMMFALVAQPFYGLVSTEVANAKTDDISAVVFTNSVRTVSVDEAASLSVRLLDDEGEEKKLKQAGAKLTLASSSETGLFAEGGTSNAWKSSESYPFNKGTANKSFRYKDSVAGQYTITATVSGGDISSPIIATQNITVTALDSEIAVENFNTVDGNYKGVSVGFRTKNFATVKAVSVALTRANDTVVTKHANQGVLDIINSNRSGAQLTTPFVIQSGEFTEANDLKYWAPAMLTSWTSATTPTSVKVTITDENGNKDAVNSVFNQGAPSWPLYESLLPIITDTTRPISTIVQPTVDVTNKSLNVVVGATDDQKLHSIAVNIAKKNAAGVFAHLKGCVARSDIDASSVEVQCQTGQLADGIYLIKVNAADQAGNNGPTSKAFIVDSINPRVNITTPARDSRLNSGNFIISGTATDEDSGIERVEIVVNRLKSDGSFNGRAIEFERAALNGDKFSYDTQGLADGRYALKAVAYDKAGNLKTAGHDIYIDTTAPNGKFDVNSDYQRGNVTIKASIQDVGGSALGWQQIVMRNETGVVTGNWRYNVQTGAVEVITGNGTVTYVGDRSDGVLQIIFDTAKLEDGMHSLRLFTADNLANGRSNIYGQLKFDNTAPAVPTAGTPSNAFERDNDFHFTWDAVVDISSPVSYEYQSSLNSTAVMDVMTTDLWKSGILTSNTIHSTGAPDGTWYWQVRAIDALGNTSAWSQVWNMTIDSVAPHAPVIATPTANQFFRSSPIKATWSAVTDRSGIKKYQVEYIYDDHHKVDGSDVIIRDVIGGVTSRSHSPAITEQGGVTIRVRAVDNAGNEGKWSTPVHYTYDATPPVVASNIINDAVLEGMVDVRLNVIEKHPKAFNIRILNMNGTPVTIDSTNLGAYDASLIDGDGLSYSWNTSKVANGQYKIQFSAADFVNPTTTIFHTVIVNNPQPKVTGMNFNTHVGSDYKGINVGFDIANFNTVSDVSVSLHGKDGSILATNTPDSDGELLALIAGGVKQLSTPFVTDPGAYMEEYWNLGERTWTPADKPVKATVTVTGTNSAGQDVTRVAELQPLAEPNGWTFETLLPIAISVPGTPNAPTDEGDDDEDEQRNEREEVSNGTRSFINAPSSNTPLVQPVFASLFTAGGVADGRVNTSAAQDDDNDEAVLGTQDTGTPLSNTGAVAANGAEFKLSELAWYWWVAGLSAAVAGWLWIAAGIRRMRGTEI